MCGLEEKTATQFVRRTLTRCFLLRVPSITADHYVTEGRYSRVSRVSRVDLPQIAQSPIKTRPESDPVARNGVLFSTVCPPQCITDVTALVRADRRSFRHYDNDSDARQRGTFVSVSLRAVWGPFILYAVVQKGSPLLSAIDELQPVRMGDVDLT